MVVKCYSVSILSRFFAFLSPRHAGFDTVDQLSAYLKEHRIAAAAIELFVDDLPRNIQIQ